MKTLVCVWCIVYDEKRNTSFEVYSHVFMYMIKFINYWCNKHFHVLHIYLLMARIFLCALFREQAQCVYVYIYVIFIRANKQTKFQGRQILLDSTGNVWKDFFYIMQTFCYAVSSIKMFCKMFGLY